MSPVDIFECAPTYRVHWNFSKIADEKFGAIADGYRLNYSISTLINMSLDSAFIEQLCR